MKNTFHRLIAGLIAASVLLCGCSSANMLTSAAAHELYDQRYSVGTASDEVNADFDDFTREIFTDAVSTDALTLHFELKDPSAYDIDLDTIDLGRINLQNPIDTFVSDISTDALRQELHDFDYEELTEKQQQTYDILDEFLETEQTYDSKTLFYYPEYLSSTSGTQSLLPVMLFTALRMWMIICFCFRIFRTALTIYLIMNRKKPMPASLCLMNLRMKSLLPVSLSLKTPTTTC